MGGGDGTSNGRLLLLGAVLDALAGEVGGTALACLQATQRPSVCCPTTAEKRKGLGKSAHNGCLGITGGLESSDHGAAGGDVDGRDGKALLAGVGEQLQHVIAYGAVNVDVNLSDVGEEDSVP